jgi:hypothetical protein
VPFAAPENASIGKNDAFSAAQKAALGRDEAFSAAQKAALGRDEAFAAARRVIHGRRRAERPACPFSPPVLVYSASITSCRSRTVISTSKREMSWCTLGNRV